MQFCRGFFLLKRVKYLICRLIALEYLICRLILWSSKFGFTSKAFTAGIKHRVSGDPIKNVWILRYHDEFVFLPKICRTPNLRFLSLNHVLRFISPTGCLRSVSGGCKSSPVFKKQYCFAHLIRPDWKFILYKILLSVNFVFIFLDFFSRTLKEGNQY